MRPARAIAGYTVLVVVLTALLTPPIFQLIHPHLPGIPFRRVFDRVVLGVALAGLWPLLRALGIRTWSGVGFVRTRAWWRQACIGLALGVGSFSLAGVLLVVLGLRVVTGTTGFGSLAGFLVVGVVVGLVEETFFRGGLQGALQRAIRSPVAIVVVSAVYSVVHFLKPRGAGIDAESVRWLSGWDYLSQVLARSWQSPGVPVGFVTLFLAGSILGLAFARTRSLYLSMGLHAGWVFTLKTYASLTDATGPRRWWGGGTLVDNMLVWPVLVVVFIVVWWLTRKPVEPLAS